MARLADGEMVLASATTVPGLAPSITPAGPSSTSSDIFVSPTHRKIKSASAPTCFGESHTNPFSSSASCFALLAVFDHNATRCPARKRFRAIGYPIKPSPRNPSFAIRENGNNETECIGHEKDLSGSNRVSEATLRSGLQRE